MDLSCILLTWNSGAYVGPCLGSLVRDLEASGRRYEVLVVDNGSTDGTLGVLAELQRQAPITVVPLGHNTGTTFSRNIALRMARGRHLAILDSDIEIAEPGTMARLLARLKAEPDWGILAPQLRFPSGRYQKTVDVFPTVTHKARRFLHLRAMEDAEAAAGPGGEPRPVDYAVSAFWVMPRAVVDRVGLLDERIFYAPEDVDYCLRVWLAGYRVVYWPEVTAVHHAQEISRRALFSRSMREHLKGLAYFWWKHGFLFSADSLYRKIRTAEALRR